MCALRDWLTDNSRKCVLAIAAFFYAYAGKMKNCPMQNIIMEEMHKKWGTLMLSFLTVMFLLYF